MVVERSDTGSSSQKRISMRFSSEDSVSLSLTELYELANEMKWSVSTFQAPGQKLPCTYLSFQAKTETGLPTRGKSFVMQAFESKETSPLINISPDIEFWGFQFQIPKSFLGEKKKESEEKKRISFFENINEQTNYLQAVEAAKKLIEKGQFQKLVISRKKQIQLSERILLEDFFQSMIAAYPRAFCYCVYHPESGLWAGASPELLLGFKEDQIHTSALAGTLTADQLGLGWSSKEIEEHEMVVEYIEAALQSQGIREVEKGERKTVQAGPVYHLRTELRATVNEGNYSNILMALHPTPAVAGLPFKNSQEKINSIEKYDREYYCGFIGVFNEVNNANVFVNLRCIKWLDDKNVQLFTGAGITQSSIPEQEWKETEAKAKTMEDLLF